MSVYMGRRDGRDRGHETKAELQEAMNRTDEGVLAWALADSASAHLNAVDRTRLCTKIRAGERDSAIKELLTFDANSDVELPWELAVQVRAWIQGYAGSDSEPIPRHVYDRINVSSKNFANPPRHEADVRRPLRRLTARRSARAARPKAAARGSTYGTQRVAICGITTSLDALVDAAIEARGLAQNAIEVAVRQARSADWSWAQISAALGGVPDEETLCRKFGSKEGTPQRDWIR